MADGAAPEVLRAARNVSRLKMIPARLLNTLDLLNHLSLVMTQEAVFVIEEIWGSKKFKVRQEDEITAVS